MFQAHRLPPRLRASPEAGARHAGHLRQLNLGRILALVMDQPNPFTRAELIQATGLSAPTVGSLVSHLIKSGVVRDLGVGPSRGGRRPSFMDFNARHGFVAGIDLGPNRTRLALADLRGEPPAHHVLAERWRGAARGHDTCVFITVGTGIGAGIVVEGALHRGHHFVAGEIGLMCMGPQYVNADFGPRGCLESLAGLKAVAARWPGTARRGPERWVTELCEAAERGDRRAEETLGETARLIGIAVANLSLVL